MIWKRTEDFLEVLSGFFHRDKNEVFLDILVLYADTFFTRRTKIKLTETIFLLQYVGAAVP